MMSSPEVGVLQELDRCQRFLIAMHVTPDGDSGGSALALGLALRQMGRQVDWVAWDAMPARIKFLPSSGEVLCWTQVDLNHYDCVVAVDCANSGRLRAPEALWDGHRAVINIDHHPGNPGFGTINWVDPSASSTGEMVTRLFQAAGWSMSLSEALCLFTAITTDTLSFRQVNTTLSTLAAIHWIIDRSGLDMNEANQLIWDRRTPGEVKFLGWALTAMELSPDGRFAWVGVTRATMRQFGVDDSAVDTVVHHFLTIEGVEVAFMVKEAEPTGTVKVSWRGRQPWNVGDIAARFGGGGHAYAAAAPLNASLEDALARVKSYLGSLAHG